LAIYSLKTLIPWGYMTTIPVVRAQPRSLPHFSGRE
jgi:hypothetical protein